MKKLLFAVTCALNVVPVASARFHVQPWVNFGFGGQTSFGLSFEKSRHHHHCAPPVVHHTTVVERPVYCPQPVYYTQPVECRSVPVVYHSAPCSTPVYHHHYSSDCYHAPCGVVYEPVRITPSFHFGVTL